MRRIDRRVGELTGTRLHVIPSQILSWAPINDTIPAPPRSATNQVVVFFAPKVASPEVSRGRTWARHHPAGSAARDRTYA